MSGENVNARVAVLEAENARLRRLLDDAGVPSTLRHQIRNVLGVLRAMIRRSSETATSVEDYAAHLEGRFDALLRVQALVLVSPDATVDLHALIADELLVHDVRNDEKVRLSGPDVRLPARTAEVLGLALHELATNAIKFGALPAASGRVAVTWQYDGGHDLTLSWAESGGVNLVERPTFRGFGMEALEVMLPYQIKAETQIEFRPDGLICTIRVPLAPGTASA